MITKENKSIPLEIKTNNIPNKFIIKNNVPTIFFDNKQLNLITKDNNNLQVFKVNIDIIEKELGIIKPETAKVVVKENKALLVFNTDKSNQNKEIVIDNKILIPISKQNYASPKIIQQNGIDNILLKDNKSSEIKIVPVNTTIENNYFNKVEQDIFN